MNNNNVSNDRVGFGKACRDFMSASGCKRTVCRFIHDINLCVAYWNNNCFKGGNCEKSHLIDKELLTKFNNLRDSYERHYENAKGSRSKERSKEKYNKNNKNVRGRKPKNTECFEPMTKPVDMRIVYDWEKDRTTANLTSRDVLIAPNIFSEYRRGELYNKLTEEINGCNVPRDQLLKMWHGNDKIEGTHLIVNDRTRWKEQCPTFLKVVERIKEYFNMNIQATRFNWYTDPLQWKPFHHDSAYVNPEKAAVQNFTVAVSFGATRDAAFEHATTKSVISFPQGDGCTYAFSKDTNAIWRHGILQGKVDDFAPNEEHGRVSIICWGWVDNQVELK